jgi:hypothetical protein
MNSCGEDGLKEGKCDRLQYAFVTMAFFKNKKRKRGNLRISNMEVENPTFHVDVGNRWNDDRP